MHFAAAFFYLLVFMILFFTHFVCHSFLGMSDENSMKMLSFVATIVSFRLQLSFSCIISVKLRDEITQKYFQWHNNLIKIYFI